MSIYAFAHPNDGDAYSPRELAAIDDIDVDLNQTHFGTASPLAVRWQFFAHAARLAINPTRESDQTIAALISRAVLAEFENRTPAPFNNDAETDGA